MNMRSTPRALLLVLFATTVDPATAAPLPAGPPLAARAAEPIRYTVSFEQRARHELRVEATFTDLEPGTLELRMARTSPGRYAIHEFAKNVYDVSAVDVEGAELPVERPNPYQWNVSGHGGAVTVRYTLFADEADGTYSQVDRSHAHLNVPATFMFARGLLERPVEVAFELPGGAGWEVASQLVPTDDPAVFTAPDVHYFMDSPIEIADLSWREWTVERDGRPLTIRVAMHHLGTEAELDRWAASARAVGEEYEAVFGTYPAFDFGTYTFLACYVPWASGDGMEHRNSTVLTSSGSLERAMTGLLGTAAHEIFHAWSVERIRPASLEPFDWEEANMSGELWFAEGFTSYYDDVALVRAGVIDEGEFLRRVASAAAAVIRAPGRRFFSPVEMSMQAPFVDAATSIDPTNHENTFLSYYTWGSVIGLGLDLALRQRPGAPVTLDDVMRVMWERHGEPERPYTVADVESALAAVTGDAAWAASFFDRYVRGRDVPDFEALFAGVGVRFTSGDGGPAWLTGAELAFGDGGFELRSNPTAGDPLDEAGLGRGDVVRTVDGRPVGSAEALEDALSGRRPGDAVTLEVEGRGERLTVTATLAGAPAVSVAVDDEAPDQARERRARWIASRAGRAAGVPGPAPATAPEPAPATRPGPGGEG